MSNDLLVPFKYKFTWMKRYTVSDSTFVSAFVQEHKTKTTPGIKLQTSDIVKNIVQ